MVQLLVPTHMMVIAIVAILFFGEKRFPELSKGLGEGLRSFRDGMKVLTGVLNDTGDSIPAAVAITKRNTK